MMHTYATNSAGASSTWADRTAAQILSDVNEQLRKAGPPTPVDGFTIHVYFSPYVAEGKIYPNPLEPGTFIARDAQTVIDVIDWRNAVAELFG